MKQLFEKTLDISRRIKNYINTHKIARWAFQIFLFIIIFQAVQLWQTRKMPETGEAAPALKGVSLKGTSMDIENFKGKNTMLYFFAPWCKICDLSIDNFFSLAKEGKEGGYYNESTALIAIAMAYQSENEVLEFIGQRANNVPVILTDESFAAKWNIPGFPSVVLIDKNGKVVYRTSGYSTYLGLRWQLIKQNLW